MADSILSRFKTAWNAFVGRDNDHLDGDFSSYGSYSLPESRSHRVVIRQPVDRSMITTIYTRLAVDVGSYDIRHVRLDEEDRYKQDIPSYLNDCLSVTANLDQSGREFLRDAALTMMHVGVAAIVPVNTTNNPIFSNEYDVIQLRVGTVKRWMPDKVEVSVYDQQSGTRKDIVLPKRMVAIVENPFYSIMNEPNSTLQRLTRKLSLLDITDENNSSNKLDLIIQLPYVIKGEARREQAESRRKELEFQLRTSKYGIGYTDGTEKVVQLNRPIESNLLPQIESLSVKLHNELGLTTPVMDGSATESVMLNYFDRTIDPFIRAIVESMDRTFISKTARTQKQKLLYRRDPFRIVPVSQIADIADKLTRNEIASSNDIRVLLGWKPSADPEADKLKNSNMPAEKAEPNAESSRKSENGEVKPSSDNKVSERLRAIDAQRKQP